MSKKRPTCLSPIIGADAELFTHVDSEIRIEVDVVQQENDLASRASCEAEFVAAKSPRRNLDTSKSHEENAFKCLPKSDLPEIELAIGDETGEPFSYSFSNAVRLVPASGNSILETANERVGIGSTIDGNSITIICDGAPIASGTECMIGIETCNEEDRFLGGTVISSQSNSETVHEVRIGFHGGLFEIMNQAMIIPIFDRTEMKFVMPYPEHLIMTLCKIGAANPMELDSVLLCPQCHSIPTVRMGCGLCLSSNLKSRRMIHHFACAHVDFVEAFETETELCCPKCRTRQLVIGSDYEYLDGANRCADCGQSNLDQAHIGHCLCCEYRFPLSAANPAKLTGYRVNRLDLLDFIDSGN